MIASAPIRVFLIDDHRSILWGLEKLIQSGGPAMTVVGKATNCAEAVGLLGGAAPDVILLDIDLGQESGLDAIPQILARTGAKILVLTGVRDKSVQDKAVLAGARGVVEKENSAETILTAIARVHQGQLWLDRDATGRVFVEFLRKDTGPPADPEQQKIESLTAREREIVAVTATNAGASAAAIARMLHVSEHTLRNHLTAIYGKLGVANRLELFAYSQKHHLYKLPG
ncbi:MAG TPA: response regulator transcription factor [Burkholderiales bacterium]|nr:response regulator transcription factor [Burkholderiales bacterium]